MKTVNRTAVSRWQFAVSDWKLEKLNSARQRLKANDPFGHSEACPDARVGVNVRMTRKDGARRREITKQSQEVLENKGEILAV